MHSNSLQRLFTVLLFSVTIGVPNIAAAEGDFGVWLDALRAEAAKRGIGQATIDTALADPQPIPRVIELDRKQPEFTLTFDQYMTRVVPDARVQKGRRKLAENRDILQAVADKYGVQARFLVAFWGVETDFGRIDGGFPVIQALVTLAYDGRRSAYFRKELFNALKILDGGHISLENMKGSWAGAMGQPQFMPSTFVGFAVDHDGDGRRDIWRNKADVFASAANYLSKSGWRGDQNWGRAVRLPPDMDPNQAPQKVKKRLSEWQAMGLRRADGGDLPTRDLRASLVIPEKGGRTAYLVYNNYHAILKWNRSHYFAIAIGTLADRIGGG